MAIPASATTDPRNSAGVPGSTAARQLADDQRQQRDDDGPVCADPGGQRRRGEAEHREGQGRQGQQQAGRRGRQPGGVPQFGDDGTQRIHHRAQVDRQQQHGGRHQHPGARCGGGTCHQRRIGQSDRSTSPANRKAVVHGGCFGRKCRNGVGEYAPDARRPRESRPGPPGPPARPGVGAEPSRARPVRVSQRQLARRPTWRSVRRRCSTCNAPPEIGPPGRQCSAPILQVARTPQKPGPVVRGGGAFAGVRHLAPTARGNPVTAIREVGGSQGYDDRLQAISVARLAEGGTGRGRAGCGPGSGMRWRPSAAFDAGPVRGSAKTPAFGEVHGLPSMAGLARRGKTDRRTDSRNWTGSTTWRTRYNTDPRVSAVGQGCHPADSRCHRRRTRRRRGRRWPRPKQTRAAVILGVPESEINFIRSVTVRANRSGRSTWSRRTNKGTPGRWAQPVGRRTGIPGRSRVGAVHRPTGVGRSGAGAGRAVSRGTAPQRLGLRAGVDQEVPRGHRPALGQGAERPQAVRGLVERTGEVRAVEQGRCRAGGDGDAGFVGVHRGQGQRPDLPGGAANRRRRRGASGSWSATHMR